jgi:hypothetical protein
LRLGSVLSKCHGFFLRLRDRYRPEKHYMRGRGPKWRAKNATPD